MGTRAKCWLGGLAVGMWLLGGAALAQAQFEDDEVEEGDSEGFDEDLDDGDDETSEESGDLSDDGGEADSGAESGDFEDQLDDPGGSSGVGVTVGIKGGGGGNLLSDPGHALVEPFHEGAGGYAFTVGAHGEGRFLNGLIGVQLGFLLDFVTNWSEINEQDVGWTATDLRIPLLAQIGTPGEGTRLHAMTGPEVVLGLSGAPDIPGGVGLTIESGTHLNWLVGLGLSAPVSVLRLGFDIVFAYNLGVPSTYEERVTRTLLPPGWTTTAQHSMDLRLLISVGYDLQL